MVVLFYMSRPCKDLSSLFEDQKGSFRLVKVPETSLENTELTLMSLVLHSENEITFMLNDHAAPVSLV